MIRESIQMTRCERVLSLSPDMGFRPYEEDLYKTFVQILLGDSDLEDLISLLVWENCNDGFYVPIVDGRRIR